MSSRGAPPGRRLGCRTYNAAGSSNERHTRQLSGQRTVTDLPGGILTDLEQIEELLPRMTPGEKALLLQRVARELGGAFPGIDTDPTVCGGEPRIMRTRIPIWLLEQARRLGISEAQILECYPTLKAADLANAWAYVHARAEEIDRQIEENEAA